MKALKAPKRSRRSAAKIAKPKLYAINHRVSREEKQALAEYALALSNQSRARVSQNTAMRKILSELPQRRARRAG